MKIFGVGMNYALHTQELDGIWTVPPTPQTAPAIFLKPDSALLKNGKPFFVPDWAGRVDYEAELVVRICRLGKSIPERFAHRYWDAVTVGIDFTARDMQDSARRQGLPWTVSKGFDGSAAIGRWGEKSELRVESLEMRDESLELREPLPFHLDVNGVTVQQGVSTDMLCSVDALISYISRFFTLRTGDLIFTGTPAGVGPVRPGDHLQGYLRDDCVLDFFCR